VSIVKDSTLTALRTMIRGEYQTRLSELEAQAVYKLLASIIDSNSASNTYGWLGKFPKLREWIGDRVINSMKEQAYAIANKKYESTLGVDRADIEDDNLGIYRTLSKAQADEVVAFFNRMTAALLSGGFASLCYDGQNFFDTDHPVYPNADGSGAAASVANIQGSATATGTPWFLLCLSGSLKPLILQQRTQPEMDEITDSKNDTVFLKDQYLYGIRYRGNFGYGFWQQAVASKEELTLDNYKAARARMMGFTRDGGDPLGIVPTHLVVPSTLEAKGRAIIAKENLAGGESNEYFGTAELIVSPWLG
jgi:phage major head subunit gpT-like protein